MGEGVGVGELSSSKLQALVSLSLTITAMHLLLSLATVLRTMALSFTQILRRVQ
jgi:hypothetical protein